MSLLNIFFSQVHFSFDISLLLLLVKNYLLSSSFVVLFFTFRCGCSEFFVFFSSYSYSFSFLNFHLLCVFASIWWVPVSEKTELIVKIVVHFIGYDYSNLLFDSTRFALSQLKRFKSKRLLNAPHILYVIYVHTLRLTINKCLLLAAQTPSHSPFKIRTPVVPGSTIDR